MFRNLNNYIMLAIIFFAFYLTGYFAYAQSYVEKQNAAHINLLENAGFESGLAKWSKTVSGSSTIALYTNIPIADKASARISTNAGAANLCSDFYSLKGLKNKNAELGISWSSNITVSNTATISVRDVSSTVLTSFPLTNTGAETGIDNKLFSFGDKDVQVCINTSDTFSQSFVTDIDSLWLGSPRNVVQGPVQTNWETYTPAITGFGTVTNSNLQWRRVGDTLKIRGSWTGSTNSAQARIPFPNGYTATASAYNAKIIGGVRRDAGGSTYLRRYNALVLSNDTNAFALGIEDDQSADPTVPTQGGSANFKILGELTIPIQGYSGTATSFGRNCKDAYECENTFSAEISSGSVASNVSPIGWITSVTGTSPYTININSNLKLTTGMNCTVTTISATNAIPRIDTSTTTQFSYYISTSSPANTTAAAKIVCVKGAADYVSKLAVQGYLNEQNLLVSYYASANKSSSTTQPIDFDSKEYDATNCNCVTTGASWKFTAPRTGYYQVTVYGQSTSSLIYFKLYKGGLLNKSISKTNNSGTSAIISSSPVFIQLNVNEYIDIRTSAAATVIGGTTSADDTARIIVRWIGN